MTEPDDDKWTREGLSTQEDNSVDPDGGGGVTSDSYVRSHEENGYRSDADIDRLIDERNASGLPTWKLRQEKERRLSEGPEESEY